ncbi:zinc finger CCCH domain-containing protein 14 [Periplaneta americana]|uniref:zinc finger CCCH domain-containing protein 14 n=1 Tax=Periplaneta americana TaxID=6978 RepID=UPI0037E89842
MDGIGVEVSQKIRSAIKAKLMELGAYVDEELPDYIMVMVANKRSREQMEDDLQLFLGANTEEFTSWLHQVLQKLQEVTVASLEKKRKSVDSESESAKKEKQKKSSEKKKVRRSDETKSKDSDPGKNKDTEKVTKGHSTGDQVKANKTSRSTENVTKSQAQEGSTSDVKEESSKASGEGSELGKGVSRIVKSSVSSKSTSNQLENSSIVPESSVSSAHEVEVSTSGVKPNSASRPKIVLMQSDDDDDEDFINIKADAEAEELLDAELPKEVPDTTRNGVTSTTKVVSSKGESALATDKRGLQLSERLGAKVTTGSILDRLGVRKMASVTYDTNKSNSPLLRVADRLGDKVTGSLRSDDVDSQSTVSSRLANRLSGRITLSNDRRNISMASHSERRNVSVAQVAPTTVNRTSRIINKSEPQQVGSKSLRRPLDSEAEEADDKEQSPRKRPLLSRVVAMRREAEERTEEEEEEYDPANPAVGSVASVVRVKPRPKVPAALQANKNLILKAMAEAQKSVASAPKRVEPEDRPEGLFTKKMRDSKGRDKIAITLPNRRVRPQRESPVSDKPSDIERIVIPVKLEATRSISSVNLQQKIVIQVSSDKQDAVPAPDSASAKFEEEVIEDVSSSLMPDYEVGSTKVVAATPDDQTDDLKDDSYDELERLISYESQSSWSKELDMENDPVSVQTISESETVSAVEIARVESPQFVVTLDGLDPSIFPSQTRKKQSQIIVSSTNAEPKYEKTAVGSDDVQKKPEKRVASPILYKKPNNSEVTGTVTDSIKQKINERCKYWPACRLGDKCDYLHPTVSCKSFPSCKFGDKCLYIHPNCKFDASCTRRDCPFTHASPRNMSGSVSTAGVKVRPAASTRVSQQVCKFFPKCSNVSCRFLHPKPCRYGRYCSRKTECSFLHEDIPSADKLKWFCPFRL